MLIGLSARFERPGRYPEVHWDGPIGEWVVPLEIFGWLFAVTALVLGAAAVEIAKSGKRIDRLLGLIGLGLVMLNVIGHCFFIAVLAES